MKGPSSTGKVQKLRSTNIASERLRVWSHRCPNNKQPRPTEQGSQASRAPTSDHQTPEKFVNPRRPHPNPKR